MRIPAGALLPLSLVERTVRRITRLLTSQLAAGIVSKSFISPAPAEGLQS